MRPLVFTLLAALLSGVTAHAEVTFTWATVGDTGNAEDPLNSGSVPGIGSVATTYNIATTEVNLFQYTEFLNTVDPNGLNSLALYNSSMASDANIAGIGFNSGAAAGSKYTVIGSGARPVTYVSWNDAARFTNWLHNGQGLGSTESGVYNMSLATPTRSATAGYWIPSENEWYKAAYYQPAAQGGDADSYWLYPMQTNTVPYSDQAPGSSSPDAAIAGNFFRNDAVGGFNDGFAVTGSPSYSSSANYLTDGGAYTSADSFYGTYDQGGNVFEWNDTVIAGSSRGLRGGSWGGVENGMRSSIRNNDDPAGESSVLGFRVASVPEPSTAMLMVLGGAALLARKRRRITL